MVIPDVIIQTLIDHNVCKNALETDELQVMSPENSLTPAEERWYSSINEIIRKSNTLCCFVDGSWLSPKNKAGIGWVLYKTEAKTILEGKQQKNQSTLH